MASLTYSWTDKTKAVQLFILTGNLRLVAEQTSIPYNQLYDWKKEEWWASLVEELRVAAKAKRGTQLSNIVDTSLDLVQDRLENGDWIYDQKAGKLVRKPVSLKDVTAVANGLMDKQIQMEALADRADQNKTTVQETLNMLAKEFQKLTRNQQKATAIDVEVKET